MSNNFDSQNNRENLGKEAFQHISASCTISVHVLVFYCTWIFFLFAQKVAFGNWVHCFAQESSGHPTDSGFLAGDPSL